MNAILTLAALGHIAVSAFAGFITVRLLTRWRSVRYRSLLHWSAITGLASLASMASALGTIDATMAVIARVEMILRGAIIPGALVVAAWGVLGNPESGLTRVLGGALAALTTLAALGLWTAAGDVWTPRSLILAGSVPTPTVIQGVVFSWSGVALVTFGMSLYAAARSLEGLPEFGEMRRGLIRALGGLIAGTASLVGFYVAVGAGSRAVAAVLTVLSGGLSVFSVGTSFLTLADLQPEAIRRLPQHD